MWWKAIIDIIWFHVYPICVFPNPMMITWEHEIFHIPLTNGTHWCCSIHCLNTLWGLIWSISTSIRMCHHLSLCHKIMMSSGAIFIHSISWAISKDATLIHEISQGKSWACWYNNFTIFRHSKENHPWTNKCCLALENDFYI